MMWICRRGGSWQANVRYSRMVNQYGDTVGYQGFSFGFRICIGGICDVAV